MAEHSHRDRVVDEVVEKVTQKPGLKATPPETVRNKAAEAVDELLDAPVQAFTPLLAENAVVSELHKQRDSEHRESEGAS